MDLPISAIVFNGEYNPFELPKTHATEDSSFSTEITVSDTPLVPVAYAGTSFATPTAVARYLNKRYQT